MVVTPRHTRDELRSLVYGYFADVLEGRRVVGKFERQFVQRHLKDLDRAWEETGEDPPSAALRFNADRAFHVLEFTERYIVHTKAEWARRPYRFTARSAWIAALLWIALGWETWDEEDREWRRRFRTVYVSVARKNGKTLIGAILALYFAAFDHEPAAEVYFAATTRDQAKLGWKQAKSCIKLAPDREFKRLFEPSADSLAQIAVPDSDSFIKALASDSDTLDGPNPYLAIIDELHAHPDGRVIDVIESGMGARREPMLFIITTAGGKRQGVCWDYDLTAQKLLDGRENDDSFLGFIARLDDGDSWSDESVWAKANPNLGESAKIVKLREGLRKALSMPARQVEFKRKHTNLWTEGDLSWLPIENWDACKGDVDLEALAHERCFIGVDLSSTRDYTAVVAAFPRPDGRIFVQPWFFIPKETLLERAKTDRVNVLLWEQEGLVTATEGGVVNQDAVKLLIMRLARDFNVIEIPMDPANASKLQTELMGQGLPVVTFQQGWVSMSPAIKETEMAILSRRLVHDGHEALRWMVGNVALKQDEARDNRSFHKGRSGDRIDGAVAMAMAIGRAAANADTGVPMVWRLA